MKPSLLKAKTTSELSLPAKPRKSKSSKAKEHYKSYRKKKVRSGRKCRVCGNDPYPNYFFCQACHHRIGVFEESE